MRFGLSLCILFFYQLLPAQDSANFTKIPFKKISAERTFIYSKWNHKMAGLISTTLGQLYGHRDTIGIEGVAATQEECRSAGFPLEVGDTLYKVGMVRIGKYSAYIVRTERGTMPSSSALYLYNEQGVQVYAAEVAAYNYGESGSANLMSYLTFDKKNMQLLVVSATEEERWNYEYIETVEGSEEYLTKYCTYTNTELLIKSIDMLTLKITSTVYNNEKKNCE